MPSSADTAWCAGATVMSRGWLFNLPVSSTAAALARETASFYGGRTVLNGWLHLRDVRCALRSLCRWTGFLLLILPVVSPCRLRRSCWLARRMHLPQFHISVV